MAPRILNLAPRRGDFTLYSGRTLYPLNRSSRCGLLINLLPLPGVKVAGSIPAGVSGFFIDIKSFRPHYGPGVDSASNRNEYQEYFLRVKAAGA